MIEDAEYTADESATKIGVTKRTIERTYVSLQNKKVIERIDSKRKVDGLSLNNFFVSPLNAKNPPRIICSVISCLLQLFTHIMLKYLSLSIFPIHKFHKP